MTVERTRQILKDKVAHLSDTELLDLIQRTDKALSVLMQLATKKAYSQKKSSTVQS